MKTILVPTDFSECALYALEFAARIAQKTNAQIQLLHVLEVPLADTDFSATKENGSKELYTSPGVPFMMTLLRTVKGKMSGLLNAQFLKTIKVKDNIEVGMIGNKIGDAALKLRADIIIMGSHGNTGYNNFFVGSNAEKVARVSPIPLLTVKHRIEEPEINKIAFATDFSDEAARVFPYIRRFADYFDADIYIVKVITPIEFKTQRENREVINSFISAGSDKEFPVTLYNDKRKEAGIIHFADDIKAGIIAIGTHGKNGISRFFSGSISEDLVNHSFLPVLTVNFSKSLSRKSNKTEISKSGFEY